MDNRGLQIPERKQTNHWVAKGAIEKGYLGESDWGSVQTTVRDSIHEEWFWEYQAGERRIKLETRFLNDSVGLKGEVDQESLGKDLKAIDSRE